MMLNLNLPMLKRENSESAGWNQLIRLKLNKYGHFEEFHNISGQNSDPINDGMF